MTFEQHNAANRVHAELGESRELDPVQRLMLAVLEDAVMTFQHGLESPCPKRRRQFHEVERWLRSDDQDSPFSFESVCSSLQLHAGRIRNALFALMREKLRHPSRRPAVRVRRTAVVGMNPVAGAARRAG